MADRLDQSGTPPRDTTRDPTRILTTDKRGNGFLTPINHYNDELFIFLGNKWKKIKLEDI